MEEQYTKTTAAQRVIIGIIAALMLISTVGVYALIVLNGKTSEEIAAENEAKLAEYEEKLTNLQKELKQLDEKLSEKHLEKLKSYRSRVKSFNANSVDNAGLKTKDIVEGTGEEITKDSGYSVYYIGWCSNEHVFDSSFDDFKNPTSISPLVYDTGGSYIAGWSDGIVGMKVGGIRQIDIPGELAYEEPPVDECTEAALKFLVYAIDPGEEYTKKVQEYNTLNNEYTALYYTVNAIDDNTEADDEDYEEE